MLFYLDYLLISQESVSLQCVFHSIRFKVNKGWGQGVDPFFMSIRLVRLFFLFSQHHLFIVRRTESGMLLK